MLPRLPQRTVDSHKGDYGRIVLIGGSMGMSGAIALAGMSALRSGAGLVTIAAPAPCVPTIAGLEPSYMTVALKMDQSGTIARSAKQRILQACQAADVVGIGPGLGIGSELPALVNELYRELTVPMIVDADALNCLAKHLGPLLNSMPTSDSSKPPLTAPAARILTPHPGELQRLTGQTYTDREQTCDAAKRVASENECVVLLKGYESLITDGKQFVINQTGNPGMATGGTGDVLTGMVTALVGQGMEPYDAARLAAHLHGLAGDLAAKKLGQHSLIASDVVRFLPKAFRSYSRSFDRKP